MIKAYYIYQYLKYDNDSKEALINPGIEYISLIIY